MDKEQAEFQLKVDDALVRLQMRLSAFEDTIEKFGLMPRIKRMEEILERFNLVLESEEQGTMPKPDQPKNRYHPDQCPHEDIRRIKDEGTCYDCGKFFNFGMGGFKGIGAARHTVGDNYLEAMNDYIWEAMNNGKEF